MKLLRQPRDLDTGGRCVCLAIGMFDGVHRGHQQVVGRACVDARERDGLAVVVTFDRHPASVLRPEHAPPLIYPLERKLELIEGLGVDAALVLEFNRALSEVTAEQFIHEMASGFGKIASIAVGRRFVFGHCRRGNVELLEAMGSVYDFAVHGLAAVALDGLVISSTRIRKAIREGKFEAASQMLGRPYGLIGQVIPGNRFGRILGFPTANLATQGMVRPPNGVYAAEVHCENSPYHGVVNIGFRPTLDAADAEPRVEVHLLGDPGDLYGKHLEVVFLARLRGERKFASLEELSRQIRRDCKHAVQYFQ